MVGAKTSLDVAFVALALAVVVAAFPRTDSPEVPRTVNGFRLEPSSIAVDEIQAGGPPRDGIPALDAPSFMSASASTWNDDEVVLGVHYGGEARAYPLAILVWHELVNDEIAGRPILVSYCPLCGTGIVFDRRVEGRTLRFGVSGLLYRSDLLMFDRASESLWSQISAEAVSGSQIGSRLTLLRSRMLRWGDWKKQHPDSKILSPRTGHARSYGRSPYGDYASSERLVFPTAFERRHHPKTRTVGLRGPDGAARAYPAPELLRAGGVVRESFAGTQVEVSFDAKTDSFEVEANDSIEVIEGYWFAWSAFHPGSEVFQASRPE